MIKIKENKDIIIAIGGCMMQEEHITEKNFHFYEYGISDFEGETTFYLPKNENYVSGSLIEQTNVEKPIFNLDYLYNYFASDYFYYMTFFACPSFYSIAMGLRFQRHFQDRFCPAI